VYNKKSNIFVSQVEGCRFVAMKNDVLALNQCQATINKIVIDQYKPCIACGEGHLASTSWGSSRHASLYRFATSWASHPHMKRNRKRTQRKARTRDHGKTLPASLILNYFCKSAKINQNRCSFCKKGKKNITSMTSLNRESRNSRRRVLNRERKNT
jgi:hypothetical protein